MAKAGEIPTTLTVERLRELLDYDPATGVFRWKVRRYRLDMIGCVAGYARKDGYWTIRIEGRLYYGHRLAWAHFYGEWPPDDLDHEDNVPGHDWIANLRPATRTQNLGNQRRRRDNTSGFKGVFFDKNLGKWRVAVKHRHIGCFSTAEDAHAAYVAAAAGMFGEYANAG